MLFECRDNAWGEFVFSSPRHTNRNVYSYPNVMCSWKKTSCSPKLHLKEAWLVGKNRVDNSKPVEFDNLKTKQWFVGGSKHCYALHPIKGHFKWRLPWDVLKEQAWWMLDFTDVSGGLGEWAVVKMGWEVVENLGGGGWGRGPQVQALIFHFLKIELMPIQHQYREKECFFLFCLIGF